MVAAEPDLAQDWTAPEDRPDKQACVQQPQTDKGGNRAVGPHYAWHLDDDRSGLRAARGAVADGRSGRASRSPISIPATIPIIAPRPRNIWQRARAQLRREGPAERRARRDADRRRAAQSRPRHRHDRRSSPAAIRGRSPIGSEGPLGGAPGARILPVRIANSVVRFTTSTMVQGFGYAIDNDADVVSMSMGGLASAAVADAVNRAYEAGMVLVTAAGNNIVGVPSPGSIVYPARFRRVIAATGVMADGRSYSGLQARHDAGLLRARQQDGDGAGRLDAEHARGRSSAAPARSTWTGRAPPPRRRRSRRRPRCGSPRNRAALDAYPAQAGCGRRRCGRRCSPPPPGRPRARRDATVAKKLGAGALRAMAALGIGRSPAERLVRAPVADAGWDWLR